MQTFKKNKFVDKSMEEKKDNSTTIRIKEKTHDKLMETYFRLKLKKKIKNYDDLINLFLRLYYERIKIKSNIERPPIILLPERKEPFKVRNI